MAKNTDPGFAELLEKAKRGDITGTEVTEIDGETNDDGQPQMLHHLKARKIFIRGSSKNKQIVPEAEAKENLKNWKKKIES